MPFEKQSARWVEAAQFFRVKQSEMREFFKPRHADGGGLGGLKGALGGR